MKPVIFYEAGDGTRFEDLETCFQYEVAQRDLKRLQEEKAELERNKMCVGTALTHGN